MVESGPEFPLTITSHVDGNAWTFETAEELSETLEWFDSDDPTQRASVVDGRGRVVRMKLHDGRLTLELAPGWPEIGPE